MLTKNQKKYLEAEKKKDPKFKTELCKTFAQTGQCPYGFKCRFAHGKEDLTEKENIPGYKQKKCNSFMKLGYCNYGTRCNFIHNDYIYQNLYKSFYYYKLFVLEDVKPLEKRLNVFIDICQDNLFNNKNGNFNCHYNNINYLPLFSACLSNNNKLDHSNSNSASTSNISIEENEKNNINYNTQIFQIKPEIFNFKNI